MSKNEKRIRQLKIQIKKDRTLESNARARIRSNTEELNTLMGIFYKEEYNKNFNKFLETGKEELDPLVFPCDKDPHYNNEYTIHPDVIEFFVKNGSHYSNEEFMRNTYRLYIGTYYVILPSFRTERIAEDGLILISHNLPIFVQYLFISDDAKEHRKIKNYSELISLYTFLSTGPSLRFTNSRKEFLEKKDFNKMKEESEFKKYIESNIELIHSLSEEELKKDESDRDKFGLLVIKESKRLKLCKALNADITSSTESLLDAAAKVN